jgi:hypothetical protein
MLLSNRNLKRAIFDGSQTIAERANHKNHQMKIPMTSTHHEDFFGSWLNTYYTVALGPTDAPSTTGLAFANQSKPSQA